MTLVAYDSETFLITPLVQAPPLVVIQYMVDGGKPELIHARDPACRKFLEWMLTDKNVLVSGHNLAFDAAVICANHRDMTPLVFDAYRANRMTCTETRQRLIDIAEGTFKKWDRTKDAFSLAGVAKRLKLELPLDKQSVARTSYGLYYNVDVKDWPAEYIEYAELDAIAQDAVHRVQDAYAASRSIPLDNQFAQSYASFWAYLVSCWGTKTDLEQVERYIKAVEEGLEEDRRVAMAAGLVRADGSKDTKKAKAVMEECCKELEIEPPKTKGGGIALDKDAIDQFGNELLESYASYGSASNLRNRTAKLRYGRIQPSFKALVDTGRFSCGGARKLKVGEFASAHRDQMTNPPRKEGYRECYIPDPGHWFWSVDWTGIELRTWAQRCLEILGHSRMAEVLNAGRDPYLELAAAIAKTSKEYAYECFEGKHGKEKKDWIKGFRSTAKPVVLGAPTGMGAAKVVLTSRKQYGVKMTLDEAKHYLALWKAEFPEGPEYHKFGKRMVDAGKTVIREDGSRMQVCEYVYPRSNRKRGGLWFTALLNGVFQGSASDLFKDSGGQIAYEMYVDKRSVLYGSRMAVPLHDEFLGQSRIDVAAACAERVSTIMCEVGASWCPDLANAFAAPPALMTRWRKGAEPVYVNGKLVPWEPAQDLHKAA